jgi:hypothetical protein
MFAVWSCPASAVKNLVFRADKPVETTEKPIAGRAEMGPPNG